MQIFSFIPAVCIIENYDCHLSVIQHFYSFSSVRQYFVKSDHFCQSEHPANPTICTGPRGGWIGGVLLYFN